jgi:hypothetical protein
MLNAIILLVGLLAAFYTSAEEVLPENPAKMSLLALLQKDSASLLDKAKEAFGDRDYDKAIDLFSIIVLQPPGPTTAEATELMGLCYQRQGQSAKAKAIYARYIKTYPDTPGFVRVRQRLLALEIAKPEEEVRVVGSKEKKIPAQAAYSGGISTYLYGSSTTDSLTQWKSDQTALITNFNSTAIFKEDDFAAKAVIKASRLQNFGERGSSKSQVSNAYIDLKNGGYGIRLGRQTVGYGTLGRFDGVVTTADYGSEKYTLMAGVPYTAAIGPTPNRYFYGVGADFFQDDGFSETVYLNRQIVNGFAERMAVGGELHYFNNGMSLTGAVEYDLLYKTFGSFMFQGSVPIGDYNNFFVINRQKIPLLLSDQALLLGTAYGRNFSTINDLISYTGLTPQQIYKFVTSSSGNLSTVVVGTSTQLTTKWNVGADAQSTNIATPQNLNISDVASQVLAAQPVQLQLASFSTYGINFHLRGNDIFVKTDNVAAILNYSIGGQTTSYGLTLDLGYPFYGARTDLLGRISKTQQPFVVSYSLYLALRLNWKINEEWSLDSQTALAYTTTEDSLQGTSAQSYNKSIYLGIRNDF